MQERGGSGRLSPCRRGARPPILQRKRKDTSCWPDSSRARQRSGSIRNDHRAKHDRRAMHHTPRDHLVPLRALGWRYDPPGLCDRSLYSHRGYRGQSRDAARQRGHCPQAVTLGNKRRLKVRDAKRDHRAGDWGITKMTHDLKLRKARIFRPSAHCASEDRRSKQDGIVCAQARGCGLCGSINSRAFDSCGPGLRGNPRSQVDSKLHLALLGTGAPDCFCTGTRARWAHALQ